MSPPFWDVVYRSPRTAFVVNDEEKVSTFTVVIASIDDRGGSERLFQVRLAVYLGRPRWVDFCIRNLG